MRPATSPSTPLYGAGETITVTVTVGELTERGLPDRAVGVGWVDRDECARHALEGASHRSVWDRNVRGIVMFKEQDLDCDVCRMSPASMPEATGLLG
jgi:hypothetical protein